MRLLIDQGNSRCKAALWDGVRLSEFTVFANQQLLDGLPQHLLPAADRVSHVVLASVAGPAYVARLISSLENNYHCRIEQLDTTANMAGLVNGYLRPTQLGVDRWLAMLGAWSRYHNALCVVDIGSAMTIDLIDAHGVHRGGLIIPGKALQYQALGGNLAAIDPADPGNEGESPLGQPEWGNQTSRCIKAGVSSSLLGCVEYAMQMALATLGCRPSLVLTGGDAEYLSGMLVQEHVVHAQLVLEGMATLQPSELEES